MSRALIQAAQQTLSSIREQGLYKQERIMLSAQSALVRLAERGEALNLCAHNYVGLADLPELGVAAEA